MRTDIRNARAIANLIETEIIPNVEPVTITGYSGANVPRGSVISTYFNTALAASTQLSIKNDYTLRRQESGLRNRFTNAVSRVPR